MPLIADEKTLQVFERWTLHHDYSYGNGLRATLDVPFLTLDAINTFIGRFLACGQAYRSPVPHSYAHADIAYWGLESNAVIDPWEWTAAESQGAQGQE